jgi:hypothetical protein
MLHQPFPAGSKSSRGLNIKHKDLVKELEMEQGKAYCYIVATVKTISGMFYQTGTAPNIMGNAITLCTCKHRMRTFLSVEDWIGKWVIGFTGLEAGGQRNALFYMMKVQHAFESHFELWNSNVLDEQTKHIKIVLVMFFALKTKLLISLITIPTTLLLKTISM